MKIFEIHGDEVFENGNGLKSYGTSDSCLHEICVSDDEMIFITQGHPELSPAQFHTSVIKNSDSSYSHDLKNLIKSVYDQQTNGIADSEKFYSIYNSFLKN